MQQTTNLTKDEIRQIVREEMNKIFNDMKRDGFSDLIDRLDSESENEQDNEQKPPNDTGQYQMGDSTVTLSYKGGQIRSAKQPTATSKLTEALQHLSKNPHDSVKFSKKELDI